MSESISSEQIDARYTKLNNQAKDLGYNLNPDIEFTKELVNGLIKNTNRYGYQSCPCRLAAGTIDMDMDIICPCDYRDPDLSDYGNCYCGLYVTAEILEGAQEVHSIPERRPLKKRVNVALGKA